MHRPTLHTPPKNPRIQPSGCLATVLMLPWMALRALQIRMMPTVQERRRRRPTLGR